MQAVVTKRERSVEPTGAWVLCHEVAEERRTPGGIVMPDVDDGESNGAELEVLAAGPDGESNLQPGDRVKIVGQSPAFVCDGNAFRLALDRKLEPGELRFEMRQLGERIVSCPVGPPYVVCVIRRAARGSA